MKIAPEFNEALIQSTLSLKTFFQGWLCQKHLIYLKMRMKYA